MRHYPKKSIPCASQAGDTPKPLSTNAFRLSPFPEFCGLATLIIRHRKQRLRIGAGNFQQRARRTRRILAPLLPFLQGSQRHRGAMRIFAA